MEIVPLTPAEDIAMVEEEQRLSWEKAQLTGEPGGDEATVGQLGLCGPVGTAGACAPKCCQTEPAGDPSRTFNPALPMTREEAAADAAKTWREPDIGIKISGDGLVKDEPIRLAVDVAEPGWAPKLAELLDGAHMSILLEAEKITNGQRQKDYGTALDNHERIARLWNGYIRSTPKVGQLNLFDQEAMENLLSPEDVAALMILMKVARLQASQTRDSLVDIAGYANVIAKMSGQRQERANRLAQDVD